MRNNTKVILQVFFSFLLSTILALTPLSLVLAISNPDDIIIYTTEVFENIFETGDMLFVVSYNIDYTTEPDEPAANAFLVTLLDTDSSTILLSRQISYYQYNITSIYVTAAQVTSLGLTWGNTYYLRVNGNPAMFGTLTEDINMDTRGLSSSDYNPDGSYTSLQLLELHCIDIAESLESDWAITLIATTTTGNQVLNSAGTVVFLEAIPGLDNAIPEMFQLSSSVPVITSDVSTANYSVSSTIGARLGPDIENAFEGIGIFLGIGTNSAAGIWAMIVLLTIMSIVFLSTGNSTASMVLAAPAGVMLMYLGAIPEAIMYIITMAVVIYAMYFFWLRGT